jgi:hypothetical protein
MGLLCWPIVTKETPHDPASPPHDRRHGRAQLVAVTYGHFRPRRHLMTAIEYRRARAKAFRIWRQETCVQIAA